MVQRSVLDCLFFNFYVCARICLINLITNIYLMFSFYTSYLIAGADWDKNSALAL